MNGGKSGYAVKGGMTPLEGSRPRGRDSEYTGDLRPASAAFRSTSRGL